eukprot:g67606.t1
MRVTAEMIFHFWACLHLSLFGLRAMLGVARVWACWASMASQALTGDAAEEAASAESPESQSLTGALARIVGDDTFADVYFIVGQGKRQRVVPAHKALLAATSVVFEAMLFPTKFPCDTDGASDDDAKNDFKAEQPLSRELPEIVIPDCDPDAFTVMLQALYSDTADITASNLEQVLHCARKYHVDSLHQLCLQYMNSGVSAENACSLLDKANSMTRDGEKHFAYVFIEEHTEEVLDTAGFDQLSSQRLVEILKSDLLTAKEVDIFKACLRWALAECQRQGLAANSKNRNRMLTPIIPHIRFCTMRSEDIATIVTASQVLDNESMLQVYRYIGARPAEKPELTFPTSLQPRTGQLETWQISPEHKSAGLTLSKKNMVLTTTTSTPCFALGDVEWTSGTHCWRVKRLRAASSALFVGVSSKRVFTESPSYRASTVWGLCSDNKQVKAGVSAPNSFSLHSGPLDLQLNCDIGTLSIFNHKNCAQHLLVGLPRGSVQPLVPHFCAQGAQEIQICILSPSDFGKSIRVS